MICRESYGVVVIGSGYGGAIVAARLAQGRSLCLSRARPRVEALGRFQIASMPSSTRSDLPIQPLGLYDYHINPEVDVFVGSGLGGTSLVNANVVIHPDESSSINLAGQRKSARIVMPACWSGYFATVRQMLQIETYGNDLPTLRKLEAHRQSTQARGTVYANLDVAVNFRRYADQPNHVGVHQRLCTLCGDCVTGCNVRAKNTLYMNYLPLAKQRGAQIFTQIEVDYLVRLPDGGYVVHYTYHPGSGQPSRPGILRASVVILAAGRIGFTRDPAALT